MWLITGYKGAIGSELVKRGKYIGYDRDNHPSELSEMVRQSDIVVHLAALTDITECELNPDQCYKDNVSLTLQVASLCRMFNKKLIFTSSCAVYGDSYPELNPIGNYGKSKKIGEEVCFNQLGVDKVAVFRLTNVFGIPKGVLHLVKTAKQNQQTLKIFGDPFRNFIHVDDVCKTILSCAHQFSPGIYNIGSDQISSVKKIMQAHVKTIQQPPLPVDIQYSHVETDIFRFIEPPLKKVEDYL